LEAISQDLNLQSERRDNRCFCFIHHFFSTSQDLNTTAFLLKYCNNTEVE
jgi:hypothetical protein